MIFPPMHGSFQQTDFFIYAAADTKYFDFYGRALVNSVLQNTPYGIHLHLYDPTDKQLEFCSRPRVTVTWETLLPNQFDQAIKFWSRWDLSEPWASRKHKMLGLKQYSDNRDLEIWIRKTYFACMRFVRLGEFLKQPQRLLEIDIDGIVRKPFVVEFNNDADIDVYLYEKIKIDKVTRQAKLTGHLAGSILFTPKPQALEFIQDLATVIRGELESDNVYWFLDQNSLDLVISKYRKGLLPMSMIDWKMDINSAIWTAKGQRKELDIFQCELARYL